MKNTIRFFTLFTLLILLLTLTPPQKGYTSGQIGNNKQTFKSQSAYDGWIREKAQKGSIGWKTNATGKRIIVGDDTEKRQYRSILSFDTSDIPEGAVITKVTLEIKKARVVGTNPFKTHGSLIADIQNGYFGTFPELQPSDFQTVASQKKVGVFKKIKGTKWYRAKLEESAYPYINTEGLTQFRLRFNKGDNDNDIADLIKFHSGDTFKDENKPQLIVEYILHPGTIIVEKQTDPDGATNGFTFSGDAAGSLADGELITVGNLTPGTYTSQEIVPASWSLTSITCDDNNSSGDVITAIATFKLEAGETIRCTFVNTCNNDSDGDGVCDDVDNCVGTYNPGQEDADQDGVGDVCDNCVDTSNPGQEDDDNDGVGDACVPGSITIIKSADPADGMDFPFVADLGNFTLDDADPDDGDAVSDTKLFIDVPAGVAYDFTESVPAGWLMNVIVCTYSNTDTVVKEIQDTGALVGVTITLSPNEDISCTFYNETQN